jgi:hypothetical protein
MSFECGECHAKIVEFKDYNTDIVTITGGRQLPRPDPARRNGLADLPYVRRDPNRQLAKVHRALGYEVELDGQRCRGAQLCARSAGDVLGSDSGAGTWPSP